MDGHHCGSKGKFLKEKHWVPSVGTSSPEPDLKLEAFSALQWHLVFLVKTQNFVTCEGRRLASLHINSCICQTYCIIHTICQVTCFRCPISARVNQHPKHAYLDLFQWGFLVTILSSKNVRFWTGGPWFRLGTWFWNLYHGTEGGGVLVQTRLQFQRSKIVIWGSMSAPLVHFGKLRISKWFLGVCQSCWRKLLV
jgi:hypothetical protein